MIKEKNIQNLLSQVNTIVNSYEKVAQATGENFNIFQIFNLERDENKMHSRFIETLLNPKGSHGQGGIFLELFLEVLGVTDQLDIETTQSKTEHPIGNKIIDEMDSQGGRIDIYLWDQNGKSISIENKIDAGDQEKQLVRYSNHNKGKNLVFYLTLNGKDTNEYSKGILVSDIVEKSDKIDFYCISYKETILQWLEKCQKEASDIPILRETIKQYSILLKKLTHQNINSKMNKEILKLVTSDKESFESWKTLHGLTNTIVHNTIKTVVIPILKELKIEFESKYVAEELSFKIDEQRLSSNKQYSPLLIIYSAQLKKYNLRILFSFQRKNNNHLIGGYTFIDGHTSKDSEKLELIKYKFKKIFTDIPVRESKTWPSYIDYWYYMNWTSNKNDLSNLIFGDFKEDLKQKIELMLGIVSQS
jgi:hypothetical protein